MNPMLALRQYQKISAQTQASEASPHRLVQMLMEGGLDRIAQAKGSLERKDLAGKGVAIGKAIGIVGGLREGLDRDNMTAELERLDSLYLYMTRRLTDANLKNDIAALDEVTDLLTTVKEGWDAVAPQ